MSIETVSHANPEWEFGDRIRKVRRTIAQLGQAEMADALGVSRQVYASWEAGRTKPSDIVAIAKRIAEIWPGRVTPSWVLGVDDEPRPPEPPHPARVPSRTAQVVRLHKPARDDLAAQPELVSVSDDAIAYLRLADDSISKADHEDSQPVGEWDSPYTPAEKAA